MVQAAARPTYGNRFLEPGSRSAQLYERACGALPGGNSRTTVYQAPYPMYAARGEGCRIIDVEGQSRVDFLNNYTALIHGHAHPAIVEAAGRQLAQGSSFGAPTESEIALAELLSSRVPSMERIRFTNSGSEAVMMAMHAARAYTGRSRIAKFEGCYHGSYDYAAVSVSPAPEAWGEPGAPSSVPDSAGVAHSVPSEILVLPLNDREACGRLIAEHAESLAAVIVDPLPNGPGFPEPADGFLPFLREVTRRHGVLLISDEIISFRIGPGGAQGVFGFTPDLTTLGKIMGGGFPIGAVGGSAEVMAVFDPTRAVATRAVATRAVARETAGGSAGGAAGGSGRPRVGHGGTFNANPMSMVAGRVAMELMTPEAYDRLNALGDRLRTGLNEVFRRRGFPAQATGRGSLFRILPHNRPFRGYRDGYWSVEERRQQGEFNLRLMGAGYLLGGGSLGCISTPMTEAEVDGLIAAVDAICAAMRP